MDEADELAQTEAALLKLEERARKGEEESARLAKENKEFLASKQRTDDVMVALKAELAALRSTGKQPAPPSSAKLVQTDTPEVRAASARQSRFSAAEE